MRCNIVREKTVIADLYTSLKLSGKLCDLRLLICYTERSHHAPGFGHELEKWDHLFQSENFTQNTEKI